MADGNWFGPRFGMSSNPMFGSRFYPGFGLSSNPTFDASRGSSFRLGLEYDYPEYFLRSSPRTNFSLSRIHAMHFPGMPNPWLGRSSELETGPKYMSREDWGAREAKGFIKLDHSSVKTVYFHHTAGAESDSLDKSKKIAKQIQDYHMNERKYADAGYSFLIDSKGNVFELRGWDRVGAHTANHNSKSIGIAFMGNYEEKEPSEAAKEAAKKLVAEGIKKGFLPKDVEFKGHCDTKDTICPGAKLYEWSKTLNKAEKETE